MFLPDILILDAACSKKCQTFKFLFLFTKIPENFVSGFSASVRAATEKCEKCRFHRKMSSLKKPELRDKKKKRVENTQTEKKEKDKDFFSGKKRKRNVKKIQVKARLRWPDRRKKLENSVSFNLRRNRENVKRKSGRNR